MKTILLLLIAFAFTVLINAPPVSAESSISAKQPFVIQQTAETGIFRQETAFEVVYATSDFKHIEKLPGQSQKKNGDDNKAARIHISHGFG